MPVRVSPDPVQIYVVEDPAQPRFKRPCRVIILLVVKRPRKCFLNQISSILFVACQTISEVVSLLAVSPDEFLKFHKNSLTTPCPLPDGDPEAIEGLLVFPHPDLGHVLPDTYFCEAAGVDVADAAGAALDDFLPCRAGLLDL